MKYIIDNDLHIHSYLSSCSGDPNQTTNKILEYAVKNNIKTICITDHFWDENVPGASGWYATQNFEHISTSLPLPQHEGVSFLFGCETELKEDLTLGISRETMDKFDFIIIPTTHLHMNGFTISGEATLEDRAKAFINRFDALLNMDLPFHKIGIAHIACGLMVPDGEIQRVIDLISDDELERVFKKAADVGVGIELNADDINFAKQSANKVKASMRLFLTAKAMGCKFYLGSDAHRVDNFERVVSLFEAAVEKLGLTEDDKFTVGN